MIKIDDIYSIGENGYGFVLYKLNSTGKTNKTIGYFHEIEGVYNEYVRQKTMAAIGDDDIETDLKAVVEATKEAKAAISLLIDSLSQNPYN